MTIEQQRRILFLRMSVRLLQLMYQIKVGNFDGVDFCDVVDTWHEIYPGGSNEVYVCLMEGDTNQPGPLASYEVTRRERDYVHFTAYHLKAVSTLERNNIDLESHTKDSISCLIDLINRSNRNFPARQITSNIYRYSVGRPVTEADLL